ncbi:MAG: MMPL family transporter, partial [Oscillospiraceae bacterium]|nr:MMPL family transporter [Oscillospiraceae bacterium]
TAMTFMKFRLGVDMGVNLIKAIVCSLLTVFLFMPAMLMLFGRAMDRTKHRRFVPKISFVGRFAYATRFVLPLIFVALVVGAYIIYGRCSYAYNVDMVPAFRQTEYEASKTEIAENFGSSNVVAVLLPAGDYASEKALLEDLSACDEVRSANGLAAVEAMDGYCLGDEIGFREFSGIAGVDETSAKALFAYYAADNGDHRAAQGDLESYKAPLLDLFLFLHRVLESGNVDLELPASQLAMVDELYGQLSLAASQLQGKNYSRLLLELDLPVQSDETFAFLDHIHVLASRYYEDGICLTGDSVSAKDFRDSFATDNRVVGLMSLGLVMLILFFTFRSFGMPLLLILVIQGSIWMNFAIATLRNTPVFFLCILIVSAIQMGANIDYAIVVSTRYREFRETMDPKEAIITTLNLAFPTVITSGLMMVCAGLLIGFQVSQCIIAGMGYYVGTGTSISIALILFALPQLLLLGDRFVALTTINTEKLAFLRFVKRNRRRFAAGLLAAAAVFALVLTPGAIRLGVDYASRVEKQSDSLLERAEGLEALAGKLGADSTKVAELKYQFAEQLVTDEVGAQLLAEGEAEYQAGLEEYTAGKELFDEKSALLEDAKAQYDAGAAQLYAGQAQYDEGLAQYNAAKAEYEAGKQKLAEGQAAYDAGKAKYDAGAEKLAEGQAAYDAGKAKYDAGAKKLAEGQAAYDAGLAEYEAGKAAYAAGQQALAEGQAAYDSGLAQYNEGKAQYDAAKAQLDAVSGLYYAVLPLYNEYLDLQAQYDAAVAGGDLIGATALFGLVTAAKLAFETQLGGYSIGGLMQEYQSAQAQLDAAAAQLSAAEQELAAGKAELDAGYAQAAAAEQQLAEAEQQLAAGKAELDAGKAELAAAEKELAAGKVELDAGKAELAAAEKELAAGKAELDAGKAELAAAEPQLSDAKNQLDTAKAQLDAGYAQLGNAGGQIAAGDAQLAEAAEQLEQGEQALKDAEEELSSGRQTLAENRDELNASLAALDAYSSEEEQLSEGVKLLLENEQVKALAGRGASTGEVIRAAKQVFRQSAEDAQKQSTAARNVSLNLLLAAALALMAVLFLIVLRSSFAPALLASVSALAALLTLVYWRSRCTDLESLLPLAALLLAIFGVLFAGQMFGRSRAERSEKQTQPAE